MDRHQGQECDDDALVEVPTEAPAGSEPKPEPPAAVQRLAARAFPETANPADYLARPQTERALAALEQALFEDRVPAVLVAPPGMGKSLLLRVLAARHAERARAIELPYGAMETDEFLRWALGRIDLEPVPSALYALRRAAVQQPLLLCIDDACSLPAETAQALAELARDDTAHIHLLMAIADGGAADRLLAILGEPVCEVRLSEPMSVDETTGYLDHRLARAHVSAARRAQIPRQQLEHIHDLSGGIPRQVHAAGQRVLLKLPIVLHPEADEDWIGTPLDELGEVGDADHAGAGPEAVGACAGETETHEGDPNEGDEVAEVA